jgi:hypothetical protein
MRNNGKQAFLYRISLYRTLFVTKQAEMALSSYGSLCWKCHFLGKGVLGISAKAPSKELFRCVDSTCNFSVGLKIL